MSPCRFCGGDCKPSAWRSSVREPEYDKGDCPFLDACVKEIGCSIDDAVKVIDRWVGYNT
jgi:hypothetical protein